MLDVSSHTHQINLWISLSKFEPTYSQTFVELGYECDVIEDRVYVHDDEGTDVIHPDVILTEPDKKEHSLIVDCKSVRIKPDQIRRYLRSDEYEDQLVIQGLVQDIESKNISAEPVLSSFSDLTDENLPSDIALIYFDSDPHSGFAIYDCSGHRFDDERINDILPINVHPDQPLPTSYYPFDVYEGDKEAMVSSVFSSVISLAIQEGEFSIEDILDRSHPYWNKLGDDKQDQLIEHVKTVYYELLHAGLEEYLDKIAGTEGREWKRTSATIQAVHRETDYYVNKVMDKLPQARLDHYTWSPNTESEADDD